MAKKVVFHCILTITGESLPGVTAFLRMKTYSAPPEDKYFSKIFSHESENPMKCSKGIKKLIYPSILR